MSAALLWLVCNELSIPVAGLSGFMEKPSGDALHKWKGVSKNATEQDPFEASMGIYVFKREALVKLLYFLTDASVAVCRDAPGVVPSMRQIIVKLSPIPRNVIEVQKHTFCTGSLTLAVQLVQTTAEPQCLGRH